MQRLALAFGLVLSTGIVYGRSIGFELVDFDDLKYVANNAHVQAGLGWETLRWAFTTGYFSNWHPLTWLSYALDVELGGTPAVHHATNVVLHALNALLLFAVLERLTGRRGRSAWVAALFALHPLHVESVAWVSERKDLLSLAFGLLAIGCHAGFARRGGWHRQAGVLVFLALGLMAKPILVTLPLLLLLLDFWPLGRLAGGARPGRLLLEKLPLLVLSAVSSAVTLAVQAGAGAGRPEESLAAPLRVANALFQYARYLVKTVWPGGLAVYYPHPFLPGGSGLSAGEVGAAAALLLGISALVYRTRARGYPVTGWLWYLGALVPNAGFVQVGMQGAADRYTYLPLVGVFLLLVWGGADLRERYLPGRRGRPLVAAALVVLALLAAASFRQVGTWRDSATLYEHALAHTRDNWLVHYNLARVHLDRGRLPDAERHLRETLRIAPGRPDASYNLALVLARQGDDAGALAQYRHTAALDPGHMKSRRALAKLLFARGEREQAVAHWRGAVRAAPGNHKVQLELGLALLALGRVDDARPELQRALELCRARGDRESEARARAALARAGSPRHSR